MTTEEITNINETHTFQCPRWHKRIFPPFSALLVCIAIWLTISLFEEFRDYNDWRDWFFSAMGVCVISYMLFVAFQLIIAAYSQITIDAQHILMKTPLSVIRIPWDQVLGVKLMHNDKAFRIIGPQRNIIFNTGDYADSDYLLQLLRDKLSPVLNRDLPSVSEDVLVVMINLVTRNRPGVSASKIYEKVLSVDRKLKYEKVKQIVKSLRNGV